MVISKSIIPAKPAASPIPLLVFSHVSARLSLLHLDRFPKDGQVSLKRCFNSSLTIERHEAESARPPCVLIHHECGIDNPAVLHKVFLEVLLGRLLANASNEDF